jgi:hypothetical protein
MTTRSQCLRYFSTENTFWRWTELALMALFGCIGSLAIAVIIRLVLKHLGWTLWPSDGPWGFYGTVGRVTVFWLLGRAARRAFDRIRRAFNGQELLPAGALAGKA